MSQNTLNTSAFIEAEVYSQFILTNLNDGLLPGSFYRNVSDFGTGSTLHIKTIGDVTLQEAAEEQPLVYSPIDTGEVTLAITDYKGDAWAITDDLREDGAQIDQLMAERAAASTRAIQENFETRFLEVANAGQTNGAANAVNGFAHRIASTATNNVMDEAYLIAMSLAFDKANVPTAGRIAIVDPLVAATLTKKITMNSQITDFGRMILEGGFANDHSFVMNFYNWTIITSNRLPKGSFSDGTTTVSNGVSNLFMSIADDNTKPVMAAWRRQPRTETERNKDLRRDEFVTTCRWGMGVQRVDTLGTIITSAASY